MESEPGADVGQLEASEFDPPLFVLFESLLEGGYPSSPPCRVVDPEVPHHGLDGWVIWAQEFGELLVDDFVCDNESCLVAVH